MKMDFQDGLVILIHTLNNSVSVQHWLDAKIIKATMMLNFQRRIKFLVSL